MVCDICKTKMSDSTTEMEISIKEKKIKVVNVPTMVCPVCSKLVVEELVDKLVRKAAKYCKDDTFDYNNVEPQGVGIVIGKV